LRKRCQETLYPADKRSYNKAASDLKKLLSTLRNESLAEYLRNLDPHSCKHEHNLWRATKYLKRPAKRNTVVRNCNGDWCRSDDEHAKAFAQHLHSVLQPNDIDIPQTEREVENFLESPCHMSLPIRKSSINEVS